MRGPGYQDIRRPGTVQTATNSDTGSSPKHADAKIYGIDNPYTAFVIEILFNMQGRSNRTPGVPSFSFSYRPRLSQQNSDGLLEGLDATQPWDFGA